MVLYPAFLNLALACGPAHPAVTDVAMLPAADAAADYSITIPGSGGDSHVRRPLPMDAYPLNLGLPAARRLVQDVLEGRATVVTHVDQLVYYGGGVAAYPRDTLHTSITVNWKMIAKELEAAEKEHEDEVERLLNTLPKEER